MLEWRDDEGLLSVVGSANRIEEGVYRSDVEETGCAGEGVLLSDEKGVIGLR